MSIDLSQFHQLFFEEAVEHLAAMESLLLGLAVQAPADDDLNAIFRAAHSIKGSSGTFGFSDIADFTHVLENLLDRVRKGEIAMSDDIVDAALRAGDLLRQMIDAHRDGEALQSPDIEEVRLRLHELAQLGATAAEEDDGFGFFDAAPAAASPSVENVAEAEVAENSSAEAADFGLFEPLPAATPAADDGFGFFAPVAAADTPTPRVVEAPKQEDRRQSDRRQGDRRAVAASGGDTSIRVDVAKVDQLINLVGELVITQAMLAQTGASLDPILHERLHAGLAQLERNTRDLQEAALSIRMMPISSVFSRFPRLVRDLSRKLNKEVTLVLNGEETALDKGLIERLADPLTHLVRNSLDHGIESPEVRRANGKSEAGTITLDASHQGGHIVVEVRDDGGGLNRDRILAKAAERGMPCDAGMSDDEVWRLIFEPGFSTAEAVTDVSGRGVGMDVVKRNIQGMGGSIDIHSSAGAGTRMVVRLPLTLAILDGMSVAVGSEGYVIPLASVVESLQPTPGMVRSVAGSERLLQLRGEYLAIVPLHEVFNIPRAEREYTAGIMVVVEANGRRAALFVDELVGQQQVVIKSLETNYRKVAGISGATIRGDGRVALILDIPALVNMAAPLRAAA